MTIPISIRFAGAFGLGWGDVKAFKVIKVIRVFRDFKGF